MYLIGKFCWDLYSCLPLSVFQVSCGPFNSIRRSVDRPVRAPFMSHQLSATSTTTRRERPREEEKCWGVYICLQTICKLETISKACPALHDADGIRDPRQCGLALKTCVL